MTLPLISVVMPVWNAGPYLEAALDSILTQSLGDFELIAVDDGSTDGSGARLAEAAQRDRRVQVITQSNRGVVGALNRGTEAARGTYIARMDSDDIAHPDRFARQVTRMAAEPDLVVLGTQVRLIDPRGRPLRQLDFPLTHAEIDQRHLRRYSMAICHPSALIRRDALQEVGGYRAAYESAEDIDLWLRLAEVGKLGNLDSCLLEYRQHFASVGYRKRQAQIRAAWTAARDTATRRGLDLEPQPPHPRRKKAVSAAATARRWGWWALGGGETETARHYAALALRKSPLSRDSWRLAFCALRGH